MNWSENYKRESKVKVSEIAQYIYDTVKMDDVIKVYCPEREPLHNRISCPFHNGHDRNLSYSHQFYRCFVCGAAGDSVSFVKDLLKLSTRLDAMKRLNQDLMLNLPLGKVDAQFSYEAQRRRKEAEEREARKKAKLDEYHKLLDKWIELDRIKRECNPMSDEYANAVKRIYYVEYLLDGFDLKSGE